MANSILTRTMAMADDGLGHDPGKARKLLAATDFEAPLRLMPIWCPRPYLSEPVKVAERIALDLEGVGFQVEIHPCRGQPRFLPPDRGRLEDLVLAGLDRG